MLEKVKRPDFSDNAPGFEYYLERYSQKVSQRRPEPVNRKKGELVREILCRLEEEPSQQVMVTDLLSEIDPDPAEESIFVAAIGLLQGANVINLVDNRKIELTPDGVDLLRELKLRDDTSD